MGFQSARVLYNLQKSRTAGAAATLVDHNSNPPSSSSSMAEILAAGDVPILGTNLITHIQVPLVLPELVVDHNLIQNLRVIGYILLAVICTTAVVCIAWTISQRSHAVVKAAQPIFLLLVAWGIIILANTIIPLSMDDNGDTDSISDTKATWICMSVPWLACCGFTTTFSALFSKTLRITRIFAETQRCHRVKVSAVDVLVPFSLLLAANVVVLILWSVLDPLVYVRKNNPGTDGWNRILSTFGACRCHQPLAYALPLATVNLGVLILAIWQAYKSRKIHLEFAESKYIIICMVSLLEALVISIPILMVVRESPQAFYLTTVFMVFCICMGVLLLIFVPKMRMAAQYSQLSVVEQNRKILTRIQESTAAACQRPMPNPGSSGVVGSSSSTASPHFSLDHSPLTRAELGDLSEQLTLLPAERLEGVVRIIRQAVADQKLDLDVKEIEVDLDQLSCATQRKLLGYVSEVGIVGAECTRRMSWFECLPLLTYQSLFARVPTVCSL